MEKRKELLTVYLSGIYALLLSLVLVNSLFARTHDKWTFIYYFTNQSNLLVLFFIFGFIFTYFKENSFLKFTRNKNFIIAVTTYISITFFIVALVLDPVYLGKYNSFNDVIEFFTHSGSAIFMWIMLFLIKGNGLASLKYSLLSLIYPLFYVILNLIVGYNVKFINGKMAFAYNFINPTAYNNLFGFVLVLVCLTLVFSLFTIFITKLKIYIDKVYHLEK